MTRGMSLWAGSIDGRSISWSPRFTAVSPAWMLAGINANAMAKGLMLKAGTVVDATLITAPNPTKNSTDKQDMEMHQAKKGTPYTSA